MALVGPFPVIGNLTDIHTSALNTLGTVAYDDAMNKYRYMKGVASTAQYDFVTYDEAYATTRAVANAQGGIAIAQAAILADQYGWYLVEGSGEGKCLTGFVDNGKVYLTSTDGSVDDTDVAGDAVIGVIGRSARDTTTGTATFQLIGSPMVMDLAVD